MCGRSGPPNQAGLRVNDVLTAVLYSLKRNGPLPRISLAESIWPLTTSAGWMKT